MSVFLELENSYIEIDNFLASKEFIALKAKDENLAFEYMVRKEHNEQAYFLYAFSRLERELRDKAELKLKTKPVEYMNKSTTPHSKLADYEDQIAWKIALDKINTLMEHVAFLFPPGYSEYKVIYDLKKNRDTIAHGDLASGINMTSIFTDLEKIRLKL